MTEAEWLACTDPMPMLEYLRGRASDRKVRLPLCASCRHFWPLLRDERCRDAVQTAELYADWLTGEDERRHALARATAVEEALRTAGEPSVWGEDESAFLTRATVE